LTIGSHAVLDTSGLWVNDSGANPEQVVGGAYINGGSITLKTDTAVQTCQAVACTSLTGAGVNAFVDITANIVLKSGSHLDLSSGGRVGLTGQFQTDSSGRAVGTGGNLTLETYATGFNPNVGLAPTTGLPTATIVLQGAPATAQGTADALGAIVDAYGFASGGKLSIQAPTIQIVADGSTPVVAGAVALPSSFFKSSGFGEYDLTSVAGGLSVAANTTVVPAERANRCRYRRYRTAGIFAGD
jgi:hypothetical protein